MIASFFWAVVVTAKPAMAQPKSWVLWTDLDGADFFWTSSNCSTMVLPDSGLVGNNAPVAPSNGGISDMLFFPDTHEVLWLEGGHLVRAWMDKTERLSLALLPGDANVTELLSKNGTGPMLGLGEDGSIAWTSRDAMAAMFFASKVTQKLWIANLSSIPPRDPSHLGPWVQVPGATLAATPAHSAPVLLANEGMVYWTDGSGTLRSWDLASAVAVSPAVSVDGGTAAPAPGSALATLGEWGEVILFEVTSDGRFLWVRQPAGESQQRLELIFSLEDLQQGPNANVASGNVRSLHSFLPDDQVSALAVQPRPGAGLPYRGNVTQLYQQVYWSVSGPAMQARIDHLDMDTGHVSTLSYAAGLERRGAAQPRPSALSVYPMPDVCVNVGCLYLRIWEECRICTEDQCDTCFLDTQDWVVKQWYATHGLFSNCIWLWPPQQGAWFVRNEVQQAKDNGLLPDDFVAQELPPDGATPPGQAVATVPPTQTSTTATMTSTTSSTSFTRSSTSSTSVTLSNTNPCVAVDVPDTGLSDETCGNLLETWCQDVSSVATSDPMLAPVSLRRDCATYPWSFKELCQDRNLQPLSSCEAPVWSYVLFAAGLGLMLATLVPLCCYAAMRRGWQRRSGVSGRGTGTISGPPGMPSGLRDAGRAESNAGTGPDGCFRHGRSCLWECPRRWNRWIRDRKTQQPATTKTAEVFSKQVVTEDDEAEMRRKSFEDTRVRLEAPGSNESWVELETDTPPETTMSIGSAEDATGANLSSAGVQQILKGTWQPGLSSSSAALAAGRLTDSMQKFMAPNHQNDQWRLLHDVEDILRTLGSALPGHLRSAAWAWHARQSGRLHRSQALAAAEEEAKSIAEDFREDLSQRLQSGVRLLEVAALVTGANSLHADGPEDSSAAVMQSLQKASQLQISLEQLKSRMDERAGSGGQNLISAGRLLDGYETLMKLTKELEMAKNEAGDELSDVEFWKQLSEETKELQKVLEERLQESAIPPGVWQRLSVSESDASSGVRKVPGSKKAVRSNAWLKKLKEATAKAARFAEDLKTSQDKKKLQEMEKKLLEEMNSCEAAASKAGASEESKSWTHLKNAWAQLQNQLDQVRRRKFTGDGDGRLSSWAMNRSKLMPKRSQTQPQLHTKDLSPELSASATDRNSLQEELEIFRKKLRTAGGEDGSRLLMAGRQHLQLQDLEKLLKVAKAGEAHSAALVDAEGSGQEVSDQWQQLRAELEDLEAELSLEPSQRPGTSGRLSLGVGSRLSPKRSKQASAAPSRTFDLPKDLLDASSSFLRYSEELARIRSQQAEDDGSNPMLTLGQAVYTQQALESMEMEVAKALLEAQARGDDEEWKSLLQRLEGLQAEIAQVKEEAERQEQKVLPGTDPLTDKDMYSPRGSTKDSARMADAPWQEQQVSISGAVIATRLSSAEQEDMESFLETLQQSLQDDHVKLVAGSRLESLCRKLGLQPTRLSTRQAWSRDVEERSTGEGEESEPASVWPLLARLSSKDRSALLSKMSDLQRRVQAGDASSWQKLEEICRPLGIERAEGSTVDLSPEDLLAAAAAAQKRMARLEEQLELQREGLQRQRRKSVQAPAVLCGHSLLHGSLLAAASKEHDQCRAESDRLQVVAIETATQQQLSVQSNGLRELLKGCEDSSLRLSQGLLQAAESDRAVNQLLAALNGEPSATAHLSAALQRLARLDDQLEQQRAARKARGRRRKDGVDDEILRKFLEEKNRALASLEDTAKELLDEACSRQVYDAWQSQLTHGLEHMLATGLAGPEDAGTPQSPGSAGPHGESFAAAMAEARRRLADLEAETRRKTPSRRPKLKAGSTFVDHDRSWQKLLEEPLHPASLKEQLQQHHERLQQWRSELGQQEDLPMLAAKLALHDRFLMNLLEQHGSASGVLEDEALADIISACKDGAQILALEILEADRGSNPSIAALLESRGDAAAMRERVDETLDTALTRFSALELRDDAWRLEGASNLSSSLAAQQAELLQWIDEHLADDATDALSLLRALLLQRMAEGSQRRGPDSDGQSLDERRDHMRRLVEHLEAQTRQNTGEANGADDAILASLVSERADLLQWIDEQLKQVDDPLLRSLRELCQRNAAEGADRLLVSDLSAAASRRPAALLTEAKRRLQLLEEEAEKDSLALDPSSRDPWDHTKKKTFNDDDWLSELEEAERRLKRFDADLEKQRAQLKRRRKQGQGDAHVDPKALAELVAERAEMVEWAEEKLQHSEDPRLHAFRGACRAAARRLEKLVISDLQRHGDTVDPSALLAEARRRLLMLEEEGKRRFQRRQKALPGEDDLVADASSTKKAHFEDLDWRSQLEEAQRRLQRFDDQLDQQRQGLQRRRKKGELGALLDDETLSSLVMEKAEMLQWAEDQLKLHPEPALHDFRDACGAAARRLEQLLVEDLHDEAVDPSALLAEARRRLLMFEEEGKQRFQRRQKALLGSEEMRDGDTTSTKKAHFEDLDWQSELEEAQRRLRRFDDQLDQQRQGLQRRRKDGEKSFVEEETLATLVSERAELVEWAEDQLKLHPEPVLHDFRDACRGAARRLEQLLVEELDDEAVDPSELLAEARRRLILMEEEAAKQRSFKRRQVPFRSDEAPETGRTPSDRRGRKVVRDEEDPQVFMADAARRLARLEEELESQRQGLCRRRLQPKNSEAGPEVLAAHALFHQRAIESLKEQRDECRADCEKLRVAEKAALSPEQRQSCRELQEKCSELEEAWNSCVDIAEILKEEVAEAMPSRLTALLRRDPSQISDEASAALVEAMRRVASFDHEVEQQRSLMQRRKKVETMHSTSVAEDAVLTGLLEEKRQAIAQCEEMAQKDEAWEDLQLLWQGPLTASLVDLAAIPVKAKTGGSVTVAEKNEAMAEAQRRLARLDEESQRQRLGLKRRQKASQEAGRQELEKLVESGQEFSELASEHREGLSHQQNNIKEVMVSDRDAVEEIESWRQMVGLEELQAAAGKMSEQLETIEEVGEETDALVGGEQRRKRLLIGEVSAEDTSAAKYQCQEMQVRLQEMRQDEEERQRLLLQRRRRVKEPPEHAEQAAMRTEENSRDLLLKAHECITEGNPADVQALRRQLHDLRQEAVLSESKEEPRDEGNEGKKGNDGNTAGTSPEPSRPPLKEELETALAESTQRLTLVNSLGAELLSQLEAVFQDPDETSDLGSAVQSVVERWRGQLPQREAASTAYMEQMGAACTEAAKAVHEVHFDDQEARQAFMAAYRDRLSSASQASKVQAELEEEGLRARLLARRRRRAEAKGPPNAVANEAAPTSPARPSTSPSRSSRRVPGLARQPTVVGFITTEAEVQNLRKTGEGFARSFFLQTEEEDEEQARRMVRRLESRSKSRSRPGTAAPSPETSPLRRGLTHSLSMTTSSVADR